LKYLVDSDWDWQVKRISFDQFMVTIPSVAVMKLLKKMGQIRFTCYDIVASIEETNMSPESFAVLKETWVKAIGILKIARKELYVTELAYLVGDPEEVFVESLKWKEVWIKVACKNPSQINGSSEVFINKQGFRISWTISDKDPPKTSQDPLDKEDLEEETDEEDPDSQDSYGDLAKELIKDGPPLEMKTSSVTPK